jgi:hypothetical protein
MEDSARVKGDEEPEAADGDGRWEGYQKIIPILDLSSTSPSPI